MRMCKMETASVTQRPGGAGLERACGELGSVAFGLTQCRQDRPKPSKGGRVGDPAMTKDEDDQVHGPAAVGMEMSQERRVGCPLGERDLGLAAQRVTRDGDLDQEEVALVEVPDVRPRVDGRVWDGLEHHAGPSPMHSGTAAARLPATIMQVELVRCRRDLSKNRSDVSDKSIMPGDVVGWAVPVALAEHADGSIVLSAAVQPNGQRSEGGAGWKRLIMNSRVVRCTDRRTPGDTSNCG